jgi:hypothetical protein
MRFGCVGNKSASWLSPDLNCYLSMVRDYLPPNIAGRVAAMTEGELDAMD